MHLVLNALSKHEVGGQHCPQKTLNSEAASFLVQVVQRPPTLASQTFLAYAVHPLMVLWDEPPVLTQIFMLLFNFSVKCYLPQRVEGHLESRGKILTLSQLSKFNRY